MHLPLASYSTFPGFDGLIVLTVALLIFGPKLPHVGRNLSKLFIEFTGIHPSRPPRPSRRSNTVHDDPTLLLKLILLLLLLTLLWQVAHLF